MIRHINLLSILFIIIITGCKQNKSIVQDSTAEKKESKISINDETSNFIFYKSFPFCNTEIGYFTQKEADEIYSEKILEINLSDVENNKDSAINDADVMACLKIKLNLKEINSKLITTKDEFPFNNLILINNNYIVVSRDGQFFIFKHNKTDKTEVPILEESQNRDEVFFNKKLIGLTDLNIKEVNYYKRFGINFESICLCNSPSLFVDKLQKKIIMFNYCDSKKQLSKIEHTIEYQITATEYSGNKIILKTHKNVKFIFERIDSMPLFKVEIEGEFSTDYIGSKLNKIFTYQPEKFKSTDCGDYGG